MHTFYNQVTSRKEIKMSEFELLNKFIEAYEEDLIQAFFEKKIGQKNNYKELIKSFFEISEIIISNAKRGYPQYTFWGKSNVPKKIISFLRAHGFLAVCPLFIRKTRVPFTIFSKFSAIQKG